MPHRITHPALMSLTDLEATWRVDTDLSLPECAYDPELHTGPRMAIEHADDRAARESVARQVCATCPLRPTCAAYAMRVRPTSGVWAGMSAADLPDLPDDTVGAFADAA
ncbi:WhiB family transcriptional regulator [Sinosporangium siamense]|uniref:4Fe-4S Wbl-type domain-containing protein n=1 Tax=Sinosporangium siamense TaxID=1367973 RepID=A0A919VAI9_9ACTN|nr:WhiB family transcriptional regulator [Sinosporangium siamense]GII91159.1 hypothetical protein Ssi02_13900 [Sinosporangium siamense]